MTYGGSGNRGGDGGWIDFYTEWFGIYNTGAISTWGGSGTTDPGGNGGYVWFGAYETGPVVNHGPIRSYGGNGRYSGGEDLRAGGDGGYIELYNYNLGAVVNSADLDANGGNALLEGNGGDAGYIYMEAGSSLRVAGTLEGRGGNGAGLGVGGDGDYVEFYVDDNSYLEGDYALGGMFVGANIDVRGGTGVNGGDGGDVYFTPDQDEGMLPGQQVTILAGYARMDFSGGNGTTHGGDSMEQVVYNDGGDLNDADDEYLGSILWRGVAFDNSGGNGVLETGGDAGGFEIYNYDYSGSPDYFRVVSVQADFDLSGGNGGTYGGDGGYWYQYDNLHVLFDGTLDNSGGNGGNPVIAEEDLWVGGDGGSVEIFSDNLVEVTGTLDNTGGNAITGNGGDADEIEIAGRSGYCTADIYCAGGNTTEGLGGDGGYIYVYSTDVLMDVSGTMIATGGDGTEHGQDGECWVNGIQADLDSGLVTLP
jgi:hypothetical protein